ncbi:MAG: hypothetical protein AUG49_26335 [Catenulispora sp. 13_1_20CM_3_70_7]|nr:MAG: hypothetical protein AUG49_26335 [Catenulispora sp. 13_1_20CM_3_70_7]
MSSKILRLTAAAGATALLSVGGAFVSAGTASAATAPTTMTIAAHHHHHDDNQFDCRWVQTHEDPDEGFALFCHEEHHHHHHHHWH